MIRCLACLCIILLFATAVSGQAITVTGLRPACLKTLHRIPVTFSGSFNQDSRFLVQLKTGASSGIHSELNAVLKDGAIEVTFSDSSLTSYPQLWLRIASAAPASTSEWQDHFQVHGKGEVTIASAASDTLNKYEEHRIQIRSVSSSEGFAILNDGSRIHIYGNPVTGIAEQTEMKMVEQSTVFTIAGAENYCGAMQTTGQARVVVNTASLVTTSVSPSEVCPGNTISVHFSSDGQLPETTEGWKVRLKEALYTGEDKPGGRTIELSALRKTAGTLEAVLPPDFRPQVNTSLNVRVLTPDHKAVGGRGKILLQVKTPPGVAFEKNAYTVAFGEGVLLQLQTTGAGPYRVKLSDGRDYFPGAGTEFNERNPLYKNPAQTTSYSVQSVSSGCGVYSPSPAPTATVTVLPGMVLDDLDPAKPFCEQQTVRLHFISNIPIPASSALTMEIRHINGEIKTVPVTRDGDYVTFKIPVFADYSSEYPRVRATFTFRLVSSAPAVRSLEVGNISIQSKPQLI